MRLLTAGLLVRIQPGEPPKPDPFRSGLFSFGPVAMSHFVYILQSEESDRYYIGRSRHPERRLKHHNTTSTGYTARYRPWTLAFTHEFATKDEAIAAEQLIKSWKSRKMTRYVMEGSIQLDERIE